ncbi:MAG: glycosyltransferase family 2 protein [Limisphaerales bacterium]
MADTTLSQASGPPKQPHVTIVMVTYKGLNDTLECIESLAKLTYKNWRIILVDQNSNDGTPQTVRTKYPWVCMIENPVNDGFTGGNNLGLRKALEFPTDYLFLLNNDTTVEPELLDKLVAPMEADPKIGIIGPTSLYYKEPGIVCWAGSTVDWRGHQPDNICNVPFETLDMRTRETGFVCGCAMFIRRAVLEQVGLLDDRFFIYFEECDLCARASRAGWKMMYLPTAKLWHKISQVQQAIGNDFGNYHWQRNRLLYLWKNGNPRLLGCLWCIASALKAAAIQAMKGQRHQAVVSLRALRDSLTGRWGGTFFTYKR